MFGKLVNLIKANPVKVIKVSSVVVGSILGVILVSIGRYLGEEPIEENRVEESFEPGE